MPITNLECCANSIQSALNGIKAGASRIELCQNLEQGGITPSNSEIIKLKELSDIKIHILILPKANQFQYTKLEFQQILIDIQFCKNLKCDGVVIGALNPNLSVNKEQTKLMVLAAKPMKVTFHRAFDVACDLENSLENIIACKCDYLLTSGQKESVEQGLKNLKQLSKLSNNRINILAGGGVNSKNIKTLYNIGIREFHLSGSEKNKTGIMETNYNNIHNTVNQLITLEN
jgi:copper homeostasis protein